MFLKRLQCARELCFQLTNGLPYRGSQLAMLDRKPIKFRGSSGCIQSPIQRILSHALDGSQRLNARVLSSMRSSGSAIVQQTSSSYCQAATFGGSQRTTNFEIQWTVPLLGIGLQDSMQTKMMPISLNKFSCSLCYGFSALQKG